MPRSPQGSRSTQRRDTILTATSQLAGMGLGATLAVLVLFLFGQNSQTDGFFAAYAAFAFLSSIAQGLRISVPAMLITSGNGRDAFDRLLGTTLLLAAAASLPMLVLGRLVAELIVGRADSVATSTATTALAVLWVAGTFQLVAGLSAAALGTEGYFTSSAVAYVSGALASILLTFLFATELGILSVSIGIAGGGLLTCSILLFVLMRKGWRPFPRRRNLFVTNNLVSGSASFCALQANYLVTLAFAARLGEGTVTLYAYAFFTAILLIGGTSGPASMILAGPLAQSWDRRAGSLEQPLLSVTRVALLLALPALAIATLLGADVLQAVLPSALSAAESDQLIRILLALAGFVILSIAATVPLLAAFALGRHRAVARVALLASGTHVGLSLAARLSERLEVLAVVTSASQAVFLLGVLSIIYGRGITRPVLLLAREILTLTGLTIIAFGGIWLATGALVDGDWQPARYMLGLLTFLGLVRFTLPDAWMVFRSLLPPRRGAASPEVSDRSHS